MKLSSPQSDDQLKFRLIIILVTFFLCVSSYLILRRAETSPTLRHDARRVAPPVFPCADVRECFLEILQETNQTWMTGGCVDHRRVRSLADTDDDGLNVSLVATDAYALRWLRTHGSHPFMQFCAPGEAHKRLVFSHTLPHSHTMSRLWTNGDDERVYGSCAVVGNSYVLSGALRGAEIDAHEQVFRINWAPLGEQWRRDVGRRVTHMIVNHAAFYCSRRTPPSSCHTDFAANVTVLSKYQLCFSFIQKQLKEAFRQRRVLLLNAAFESALRDMLRRELHSALRANRIDVSDGNVHAPPKNELDVSTGLLAVFVATALCRNVSVYGFGTHGLFIHNYWTMPRLPKDDYRHSFDIEQHVLQALAAGRMPPSLDLAMPVHGVHLIDDSERFQWSPLGANGTEGGHCRSPAGRSNDGGGAAAACDEPLQCVEPLRVCVDRQRESREKLRIQENKVLGTYTFHGLRVPVQLYVSSDSRTGAAHRATADLDRFELRTNTTKPKCSEYTEDVRQWMQLIGNRLLNQTN